MRRAELHRARRVPGPRARCARASATSGATPDLRDPLLVMAVVGMLAFNFTITLPLLARNTFHGGAGTYSAFTSVMGCGRGGGRPGGGPPQPADIRRCSASSGCASG